MLIGVGLPDDVQNEMKEFLVSIKSNLIDHLIERTEKRSPYKLIEFTNQKAIECRVEQKLGKTQAG